MSDKSDFSHRLDVFPTRSPAQLKLGLSWMDFMRSWLELPGLKAWLQKSKLFTFFKTTSFPQWSLPLSHNVPHISPTIILRSISTWSWHFTKGHHDPQLTLPMILNRIPPWSSPWQKKHVHNDLHRIISPYWPQTRHVTQLGLILLLTPVPAWYSPQSQHDTHLSPTMILTSVVEP
jgi:hypothetical protein